MEVRKVVLFFQPYKFLPYEKRLAILEVEALLSPSNVCIHADKIELDTEASLANLKRLVYFSRIEVDHCSIYTTQFLQETQLGASRNLTKQNTRYSVHGLHEYKGKFNPQIVGALLNIFNVQSNGLIFDPFCGSGTTLVEAQARDIAAIGTDINPMAVFIANAKLAATEIEINRLVDASLAFWLKKHDLIQNLELDYEDERIRYLSSWFPNEQLRHIEAYRNSALALGEPIASIFLMIISNLLREYSLQEPSDLRIRRRFSSFPTIPIDVRLQSEIEKFLAHLRNILRRGEYGDKKCIALNLDVKDMYQFPQSLSENKFDFALTSPPYATALPYIDTQRLSLVWLELVHPNSIRRLEGRLIGSRDFFSKAEQQSWESKLIQNELSLHEEIHQFCYQLYTMLSDEEGFRKKALPALLYRYFFEMRSSFTEVFRLLKKGSYFCVIVGHNHTRIGGKRTEIETPRLLARLADEVGFEIADLLELDVYQRFGIHAANAVGKETMIILKKQK